VRRHPGVATFSPVLGEATAAESRWSRQGRRPITKRVPASCIDPSGQGLRGQVSVEDSDASANATSSKVAVLDLLARSVPDEIAACVTAPGTVRTPRSRATLTTVAPVARRSVSRGCTAVRGRREVGSCLAYEAFQGWCLHIACKPTELGRPGTPSRVSHIAALVPHLAPTPPRPVAPIDPANDPLGVALTRRFRDAAPYGGVTPELCPPGKPSRVSHTAGPSRISCGTTRPRPVAPLDPASGSRAGGALRRVGEGPRRVLGSWLPARLFRVAAPYGGATQALCQPE
jgi:hypothetical protein